MFHIDKTLVNKVRMSVTPMSIYFFLLPADRGVTVLHHVSDVIQSNLKWRINPNSAAKIQKKIEIQKIMNNILKKITYLFFTTTIYYLATLPENIDTFLRK